MNPNTITKEYQAGNIERTDAAMLLAEEASPLYIAGSYLTCIDQRNEYRDELYATQDKTPRPTMDASILLDLIDHAQRTDYISAALAERWLLSVGLGADDAKHHVETIATIKNRDAERAESLERPDDAPRFCTRCGIPTLAKHLSHRGICAECSAAAVEQAIKELQAKAGPVYRKWREKMVAYCYTLENEIIAATQDREPVTLGDMIDAEDQHYDPDPSPHPRKLTRPCPNCKAEIPKDTIHCNYCDTGYYDWRKL